MYWIGSSLPATEATASAWAASTDARLFRTPFLRPPVFRPQVISLSAPSRFSIFSIFLYLGIGARHERLVNIGPHFGGPSVGCALATAASFLSGCHASVLPIYFRSTLEDAAIFGHAAEWPTAIGPHETSNSMRSLPGLRPQTCCTHPNGCAGSIRQSAGAAAQQSRQGRRQDRRRGDNATSSACADTL
jgi:hypothetical protein